MHKQDIVGATLISHSVYFLLGYVSHFLLGIFSIKFHLVCVIQQTSCTDGDVLCDVTQKVNTSLRDCYSDAHESLLHTPTMHVASYISGT